MTNDFDIFSAPEDDHLAEKISKGSYRWFNKGTAVLGIVLLFSSGVASGIWYSKRPTSTTTSNGTLSFGSVGASNFGGNFGGGNRRSRNGGSGVSANFGGFGGGGSSTQGTITKIQGNTIYLRGADGQAITVKADSTTPVIAATTSKLNELKVGDAVTVSGQVGNDGTITPTAVSKGDLPAGLRFGGGNFGGGNFGGGNFGGGNFGGGNGALTNNSTGQQTNSNGGAQNRRNRQNSNNSNANNSNTNNANGGAAATGRPSVSGNGGGGNGGGGNGGGGNGGGGNGGGGGRGFNNPEFTSCLSKNGVAINQGERPDMQDPKVQAAFEKCRSLLPQGGNFGNRQQQGQATTSSPNG
jgi:hypothetical protein